MNKRRVCFGINSVFVIKDIPRVFVTDEAKKVIHELRAKHGALMFHQSGDCCDGSSPMCCEAGEFL